MNVATVVVFSLLAGVDRAASAGPSETDDASSGAALQGVDVAHLRYAVLQCKYANGLADVLRTFYDALSRVLPRPAVHDVGPSSSSVGYDVDRDGTAAGEGTADVERTGRETVANRLVELVADLDGTKTLFERMAYNLFYYSDRYPQLRTADRGLLKTVLSANLFLLYGRERGPFIVYKPATEDDRERTVDFERTVRSVRVLNNTVGQLVSLVQRFRYKNCIADDETRKADVGCDDAPHPGEIRASRTAVKSKIDCLARTMVDDVGGSIAAGIYDPKNFLFEGLLTNEFMARAMVTFAEGCIGPLVHVYNVVLATYNVESILNYQNMLFDVIGQMFVRQMHNALGDPDNVAALRDLKNAFDKFVDDVLPNNCELDVCDYIFNVHVSLSLIVFELDHDTRITPENATETRKTLHSLFYQNIWTSEDLIDTVNGVRLSSFVDEIAQNVKGFKVFRQVVGLLSYESNTNSNYFLLKVHDMPEKAELPAGDVALAALSKLQFELCSFRNVCRENRTVNSDVRGSFLYTVHYAMTMFEEFKSNRDIRNGIILPLLVYLRNVIKIWRSSDDSVFVGLEHMLWFTITVIENYLFRTYKWLTADGPQAVYNLQDPEESKKSFTGTARNTNAIDHISLYESLFTINKNLYFNDEFPSNDTEKLRFYWNGALTFVDTIFREARHSIIDIQDLINHRMLVIKWFWAKILLKIKHALSKPSELLSCESVFKSVLVEDLRVLVTYYIPFASNEVFGPAIDSFIYTINSEPITQTYFDSVDQTRSIVEKSLLSLGVTADSGDSYDSTRSIVIGLLFDIQSFLAIVLKIYDENELKIFSATIGISTALFPI